MPTADPRHPLVSTCHVTNVNVLSFIRLSPVAESIARLCTVAFVHIGELGDDVPYMGLLGDLLVSPFPTWYWKCRHGC